MIGERSPTTWGWWCSSAAACWCCFEGLDGDEAALFWIIVGFVLVFVYTSRGELRGIGERVMAELMPGRAALRSERTVEIVRGRGGDYQVAAQVNGARVAMVLDTGASAVILTQEAAKAAGLPIEAALLYGRRSTPPTAAPAPLRLRSTVLPSAASSAVSAGVGRAKRSAQNHPRHELPQPARRLEISGDKLMMRGKP